MILRRKYFSMEARLAFHNLKMFHENERATAYSRSPHWGTLYLDFGTNEGIHDLNWQFQRRMPKGIAKLQRSKMYSSFHSSNFTCSSNERTERKREGRGSERI